MKYVGSKNRLAKRLLPIMLERRGKRPWVEPFVGGGNMIDKVANRRIGGDKNKYVVALLREMAKPGFQAPWVPNEIHDTIKADPAAWPEWIVGFALVCMSYGGKWRGGYARAPGSPWRDLAMEAIRNVEAQAGRMQGCELHHCDYRQLPIPPNSLIYCDPPYKGARHDHYARFSNAAAFDHRRFWDWCRGMSGGGHVVFISEYEAPADFECVFAMERVMSFHNLHRKRKGIERLFLAP